VKLILYLITRGKPRESGNGVKTISQRSLLPDTMPAESDGLRKVIAQEDHVAPAHHRMSDVSLTDVTELLTAWSEGDSSALAKLLPLVKGELHRLAHRYMRQERKEHTLQTTALVNEAYLKLVDQRVHWRNRAHFFGISAQIMRRILIDHARQHLGPQRGGGKILSLEDAPVISEERANELVALDDALEQLMRLDPRKARVVELRYFGGLSVDEICVVLNVSPDTVTRDWRRAKAFLRRELSRS
jgi:RNA polymerase sigma-70 factor (ECF subfamily)